MMISNSARILRLVQIGFRPYAVISSNTIPKAIRWSLLLFVFSIPLDSLSLIEGIALTRLFGLLFFFCYFLHLGLPFRLKLPPIYPAMWWFAIYGFTVVLSLFSAAEGELRESIVSLFSLIQLLVLFWFSADLLRDEGLAKRCLLTFTFACVTVAAGTLLGLPGFDQEIGNRAAAFDLSPNYLALLMAYATLILGSFCLYEKSWSGKRKLAMLGLAVPLLVLMVSSGSRSGLVTFLAGALVFFIIHRDLKKKFIASIVGLVGIAFIIFLIEQNPLMTERWEKAVTEGDTTGRGEIYRFALELIGERPILGYQGSLNAAQALNQRRSGGQGRQDAHNLYLRLLLEGGLLGALPFLVGLGICVLSAWNARNGPYGPLPFVIMTCTIIFNMTASGVRYKELWLFLGLTLAAAEVAKRARITQGFLRQKTISAEVLQRRSSPDHTDAAPGSHAGFSNRS